MKNEIKKYLESHRLMQLSTSGKKPWICTVFYAADEKFNIYFVSNPKTRHCSDIKNNKFVACAVTDSNQKVTAKKMGLQIEGTASQITSEKEITNALELWNRANPGLGKTISMDSIRSGKISDRVYVIKPSSIQIFNENYGSEAIKTLKLE